jgi:assimilatory nitrate reductase catalytic subunit
VRHTDTTRYAHVLLPAAAWGEKEGTVTNSERRISRQRTFLKPLGESQPDWWMVAEVAKRLGHGAAFDYPNAAAIFREHAALSAVVNDGSRDFDLSGLAGVSDADYAQLAPVQWPVTRTRPKGTARLFGDGAFFTPSGRARFLPIIPRAPANPTDSAYPLVLNTGRVRDHWHTLTRTGLAARLSAHTIEPCMEIHPQDAASFGVADGALVRVASKWGQSNARVRVTDSQRRGSVFVPMHWNDQFGSSGCIDAVVNPATDPVSGEPEFKHTPVRIEPLQPKWYGFLLSRRQLIPDAATYWAAARGPGLWRYELAGDELPQDWASAARAVLCAHDEKIEWIEYFDKAARRYRAARLTKGKLESCIFIGPNPELPPRDWLAGLFALEALDAPTRAGLLAGLPPKGSRDMGRQICACFGVGETTILEAIQSGCATVADIGVRLKAGTNCGSCVPELKALLAQHVVKKIA